MLSVQQIINRIFRSADSTLAIKQSPPTGWKVVADTITSTTEDEASEFDFGLAAGELSDGLHITNDGTAAILVSLDGGATYRSIDVGATLECDVARTSVHVKSAAASQAFTLMVGGAF